MKIIADTSIWIEFLKFNKEYYFPFKKKLENLEVFAVECVFGELLQGIKSKNEQQIILKYWNSLPKLNEAGILIKAGVYSSDNNLVNKGIGLIDSILIVLARENRLKIWTKDKKLSNFLNEELIFLQADFSGIKGKDQKLEVLDKIKSMNLSVRSPENIEAEILKGRETDCEKNE